MLKKLILAAVITFSLNLFVGVRVHSPPQSNMQQQAPEGPIQTASQIQPGS